MRGNWLASVLMGEPAGVRRSEKPAAYRRRQEEYAVRFRQLVEACVAALLATSCSLEPSGEAGSVNVSIEVDKVELPSGQSVTVTVTALNVGNDPVTLTGPSDCLLYVDILNSQGLVVWHSNAACSSSTVTESLAAGRNKIQSFVWNGTGLSGLPVSAGYYLVRGVARTTGTWSTGPTLSITVGS